MTSRWYSSISKSINLINKHLLLLDSKVLVPEWIRFLLWLREATDSPGDSAMVTLKLPSYISIMSKLPSSNYGHCLVDTTWFDEFIAHLGGGVGRVLSVFWCGACFGAGLRLRWCLGTGSPSPVSHTSSSRRRDNIDTGEASREARAAQKSLEERSHKWRSIFWLQCLIWLSFIDNNYMYCLSVSNCKDCT